MLEMAAMISVPFCDLEGEVTQHLVLNHFICILIFLSQDLALVRKSYGLEKRIAREGAKEGLQCGVQYWTGAWEVEEIFAKL